MNLETRIEKLEARHREREDAEASRYLQRANRDADGHVVACTRYGFPPVSPDEGLAGMAAAMTLELFHREACIYTGCEYRDTCRADGSPAVWGQS